MPEVCGEYAQCSAGGRAGRGALAVGSPGTRQLARADTGPRKEAAELQVVGIALGQEPGISLSEDLHLSAMIGAMPNFAG